ncbi:uncharacterized protein LOC121391584, partial [Gigantopelta aegis]|uniref:uncharacterized protein LOC121391584 n=1 Tax=Gigantopelta aegis TaxID=1735272 RepID=UPI001B88DC22
VTPQPLREINFSRHKKGSLKRKRTTPQIEVEPVDERAALRQLKQIFPKACVLTKNDSDTDTASEDEEIPQLLTRFHEVEYSFLTPEDLQKKCEEFMKDFKPTQHQIDNLEKMTRSQADSTLWHRHREGRITATVAHDIKTRRETTPTEGLLNRIMKYNETDISKMDAVSFGLSNEPKAKMLYCEIMKRNHNQFELKDSGLVIDATCPIFAASPDGVRT